MGGDLMGMALTIAHAMLRNIKQYLLFYFA